MFPDFGALPPEINATRLYAGPGSGPMLAASSAWQGLANELSSAATKYQLEITGLANTWKGVAGQRMAAAAAPHIQWLTTTAAEAEQAGAQAAAQGLAYETARAATTPPPVIAANRSLQASLLATNILGQNTAAIMATETLYLEMWAQCAAAMYSYAAATAQSSALPQHSPARQNTNPTGALNQAAAMVDTTGAAGATGGNSLTSFIPSGLTGSGGDPAALVGESLRGPFFAMGTIASGVGFLQRMGGSGALGSSAITGANGMLFTPTTVAATTPGLSGALGSAPTSSPITASLAGATRVGRLSVPASWAGTAPSANATMGALSGGATSGASGASSGAGTVGGVPLSGAGAAGRGIGDGVVRTGPRAFVMPRPMSAG